MIFTESDPTFLLADSNEKAVIVQKKAVARAANSPRCALIKLITFQFLSLNLEIIEAGKINIICL
jgi:hypothetical protein